MWRAAHLGARGRPRGGGAVVVGGLSGRRDELIYLPIGERLGGMPAAGSVDRLGLRVTGDGDGEGGGEGEGGDEGGGSDGTTDVPPKATTSKGAVARPFILSEGLPPVPHKLLSRIQRGEYVDMAELLRDNLEAQRRSSSQPASCSSTGSNPSRSRREISDLLSWVQCFGIYIAVVTSKQPERMRQLMAYQTLMVREARRCGGKGWLAYDSYFPQQAVGDDKADWSRINQSLYAVTFIAQGERDKGRCCVLCLESDHVEEQCALYTPPPRQASYKKATEKSSSEGRDTGRGRGGGRMACFAWNQGDCRFPACKYRHVCVRCSSDHRISQCPLVKGDKDGKAPRVQVQTEGR